MTLQMFKIRAGRLLADVLEKAILHFPAFSRRWSTRSNSPFSCFCFVLVSAEGYKRSDPGLANLDLVSSAETVGFCAFIMQDSEQSHNTGSGWVSDGMRDVQGLATVGFLVNSYVLLICLFFLLKTMSISGGVESTEVTTSSFLTVSAAFCFIIWGHLLPSGAMMDSRFYSFLPVPPPRSPDLSTAVSCDLASQCALQVLVTTATSGVFSGRDW